jgi:hypothetical protein
MNAQTTGPPYATFKHGDETLTLWVEKQYPDDALLGWCPELSKNMLVHPANVVKLGCGDA